MARLSPHYFLSAFKKWTGKTPHRFLTEMRIAKSRELLMKPQMSIVAVAPAVGFSSQSHFTTVFGRFTKTMPPPTVHMSFNEAIAHVRPQETTRHQEELSRRPEPGNSPRMPPSAVQPICAKR